MNYPLPNQVEVDACLQELREQRAAREAVSQGPVNHARKRAPGLPIYLDCPHCDGTGYQRIVVHSHRCECGGRGGNCPGGHTESRDCDSPLCFDGMRICFFCHESGAQPRVENPGANYLVAVLATRMDGDEAVCEAHFAECQAGGA